MTIVYFLLLSFRQTWAYRKMASSQTFGFNFDRYSAFSRSSGKSKTAFLLHLLLIGFWCSFHGFVERIFLFFVLFPQSLVALNVDQVLKLFNFAFYQKPAL